MEEKRLPFLCYVTTESAMIFDHSNHKNTEKVIWFQLNYSSQNFLMYGPWQLLHIAPFKSNISHRSLPTM